MYCLSKTNKTRTLEQDRVNRNWEVAAEFNFEKDFSIYLSDRANTTRRPGRFTRRTNITVVDPVDDPVTGEPEVLEQFGFNTFTQPRQLTQNKTSVEINLPDFFNKLDFILGYSNTDVSYKQRSFNTNDRNTNTFSGRLDIEPLPKTTISTGFEYSDIKYDKSEGRDSIYRRASFDILWKTTVKSYFFFNTNYKRRDYGRESIFSNFRGYDATLGYRFNITNSDNLLLKFEKSLAEQQFMINPDNSAEGENNPQDWTQINMKYTHYFPRRFSVEFSPAIQKRGFRERQILTGNSGNMVRKHQEITTLRLEVNGKYTTPHEWLFVEISYRHIDIRSNVAGSDMIKKKRSTNQYRNKFITLSQHGFKVTKVDD